MGLWFYRAQSMVLCLCGSAFTVRQNIIEAGVSDPGEHSMADKKQKEGDRKGPGRSYPQGVSQLPFTPLPPTRPHATNF